MRAGSDDRRAVGAAPVMELRVMSSEGEAVGRALARVGLTLGRAAANDLVVDEKGVGLVHARVFAADRGGGLVVRAVGTGLLVFTDGVQAREVGLVPGVTFRVGEGVVACFEVGGEGEAANGRGGDGVTAADSPDLPVPGSPVRDYRPVLVACPACFRDVSRLPVEARFCPACGERLPARDGAGFLVPPEEDSPLYPVYQKLRDDLSAKLAAEGARPSEAGSLIILAYANALLRLGWTYEHGKGVLRNVEEAGRCYAKAGRLSEVWREGREGEEVKG